MNEKETKKIRQKMVVRYFRINRFIKNFSVLILIMQFILLCLYVCITHSESFLSLLLDPITYCFVFFPSLFFASLAALEKINLDKKKKEFEEKIKKNQRVIDNYMASLDDRDNPTATDINILSKSKKREIKNEKLQFVLDIINLCK